MKHPTFAANLRAELAYQRIKQEELAADLRVTQTAVSYWCTGKREPSLGQLYALREALGVSYEHLLR